MEESGVALAVRLQHRHMLSWLRSWRLQCLQKQAHGRLLARLLSQKAQARLAGVFHAWSSHVAHFRYSSPLWHNIGLVGDSSLLQHVPSWAC